MGDPLQDPACEIRVAGEYDPRDDGALTGHHRWLLSYADFLTLLFALFVVLLASSYTTHKRASAVSAAAARALIHKPPEPDPALVNLARTRSLLVDRLAREIDASHIEIRTDSRGLAIMLRDGAFFRPGDDGILPGAYGPIDEIARAIAPLSNLISVEGHSDARAIHNSRFGDNWELSSARGLSLLRYLTERYGIAPERLSAAAYADTRPQADNNSASGRARNRRVDIVILSETAQPR
jgi:chemotaxis protein MotB